MLIRYLTILISLLLATTHAPLAAPPQVMASIKPVHSLVAGVLAGVSDASLLIEGGQSPHHFSLRPSDARKLQQADLIVWIGEDLETPLLRLTENLSAEVLTLQELDFPQQHKTASAKEQETEHIRADHDTEHRHSRDPHLWLSPENAQLMVSAIATSLARLDPANASRYQNNAQALSKRLRQMDKALAKRLGPYRQQPFIVFHDAYGDFVSRYHLNSKGAVVLDPRRSPGARHVHEIRQRIRSQSVRCVFSEPQFEPRLIAAIVEDTGARVGALDPIGINIPAGPEAYFQLMEQLADNFVDCLSRQP